MAGSLLAFPLGTLFSGSAAHAAGPVDVTSIVTSTTAGTPVTLSNVAGATDDGAFASAYPSTTNYTLKFDGSVTSLTKITTADSQTYAPTAGGVFKVRRNPADAFSHEMTWRQGTFDTTTNTFNMKGSAPPSAGAAPGDYLETILGSGNINQGTDNLFSNAGNNNGNNSDVERVDFIFSGGLTVKDATAFVVMERGVSNAHDGFKVAAITALDVNGDPSNYSSVINEANSGWGTTSLGALDTIVLRDDTGGTGAAAAPDHPSANPNGQALGGVLFHATDFGVAAGQKIYGYSLFASDVAATGAGLVNYKNFPTATTESATDGGGIDLVATGAFVFTNTAPEPGTLALVLLSGLPAGAGIALVRRRRRQR